ncbi:hypothetical protein HSEST_1392 [Halapricum desulfuricans]|uniref:Uncharacterized protein n=1 Tax=Halapricum desulfuricans TaxID=2841257 RepID=A0A897NVZ6_9EURY|nr:hypothetical protein HSEST_1392 [Halapricum desulfuricans]
MNPLAYQFVPVSGIRPLILFSSPLYSVKNDNEPSRLRKRDCIVLQYHIKIESAIWPPVIADPVNRRSPPPTPGAIGGETRINQPSLSRLNGSVQVVLLPTVAVERIRHDWLQIPMQATGHTIE